MDAGRYPGPIHVIPTQVGIHASFGMHAFDDNTHDQQPSDESPTSSVEQGAPGVDAGLRRHDGGGVDAGLRRHDGGGRGCRPTPAWRKGKGGRGRY